MWNNRANKIYLTSDPNLLITAVCSFPNLHDTIEKVNEYYEIDKLHKDSTYLQIMAYYNLMSGCEFIPVAFADKVPKLHKLQALNPIHKGFFWCIGYVSPYLENGTKALRKFGRSVSTVSVETGISWLTHLVNHYNASRDSSVAHKIFEDALRKYIFDNSPEDLDKSRRFHLIYNNSTIIDRNRDMTVNDWIQHLENLKNRDIYEIIVNDFK